MAQGGCICGRLRYGASNPPLRVTICHCRFCQRATGSAFLVEPVFADADFTVLAGTAAVYRHISQGSGKAVDVHFCRDCGTKLFLRFERFPGAVGVYGGTFDDPDWYDRSPETTKHIFLGVAMGDTLVPPGMNCFEAHAMTNDGEPVAPRRFDEATRIGDHRG